MMSSKVCFLFARDADTVSSGLKGRVAGGGGKGERGGGGGLSSRGWGGGVGSRTDAVTALFVPFVRGT